MYDAFSSKLFLQREEGSKIFLSLEILGVFMWATWYVSTGLQHIFYMPEDHIKSCAQKEKFSKWVQKIMAIVLVLYLAWLRRGPQTVWVRLSCQEGETLGMQKPFGMAFLKRPNFSAISWNWLWVLEGFPVATDSGQVQEQEVPLEPTACMGHHTLLAVCGHIKEYRARFSL